MRTDIDKVLARNLVNLKMNVITIPRGRGGKSLCYYIKIIAESKFQNSNVAGRKKLENPLHIGKCAMRIHT